MTSYKSNIYLNQKKILKHAVTILTVILCYSCATQSKQTGPTIELGRWAYAPATMNIHPLSRFDLPKNSDDEAMIVIHLELLDGDGFSCRGVGSLKVSIDEPGEGASAMEIVPLNNPEINRQRFDPVTRTYRVHFNNVSDTMKNVVVRASFISNDGKTIRSKKYKIQNYR